MQSASNTAGYSQYSDTVIHTEDIVLPTLNYRVGGGGGIEQCARPMICLPSLRRLKVHKAMSKTERNPDQPDYIKPVIKISAHNRKASAGSKNNALMGWNFRLGRRALEQT